MRTIEELTRELASVLDELIAVPPDDFARRHALLKRRDALRAEAERFEADFDEQRPTEDLLAELGTARDRLKSAIDALSIRNMMSGPGGSGGAAGAVSGEMATAAIEARKAANLGPLFQRVSYLELALAERGVAPDVIGETAFMVKPGTVTGEGII